jgi:hypothetical protein
MNGVKELHSEKSLRKTVKMNRGVRFSSTPFLNVFPLRFCYTVLLDAFLL